MAEHHFDDAYLALTGIQMKSEFEVRFTKDVEVTKHSRICCFSGDCKAEKVKIIAGTVLIAGDVSAADGKATIYVPDADGDYPMHPDRLLAVPVDTFYVTSRET